MVLSIAKFRNRYYPEKCGMRIQIRFGLRVEIIT